MVPELREAFNESFTERKYQRFLQRLNHRCRTDIPFRVSETPLFVPRELQRRCEEAAIELAQQAHHPDYLRRSDATLRPEIIVPGQPPRSLFLTVDFAIAIGEGDRIEPKLVELQGFPSLMGFQLALAELTQEHYELPPELDFVNGGHTRAEYIALLRDAIVADEDPENVVLLELDPWRQKTRADFEMMRELLGLSVVAVSLKNCVGGALMYENEGRWIPIRRIFNRAIVDDIERRGEALPFDWRDELDVVWAGHPNWYFRISKFTLPFLRHPTVPRTAFLDELDEIPEDLDRYVLKPLFSFAGTGVIVGPTRDDVANVRPELRGQFVLQERVTYADAILTPEGRTRAEFRVMLLWPPEEDSPRAVMGLVRMSRGAMMGVDQNATLRWIGAGCNFYEPA